MQHDLTLVVNGQTHGGWQTVNVMQSIEHVAGTFDLSITEKWAVNNTPTPIKLGDACTVLIDGQTVITGFVDDVGPSFDAESHTISITGRARTGDLVDCAAVHHSGQWKDRTLVQIATDLCRLFRIDVIDQAGASEPFKIWKIHEGETIFGCLERAARIRGVLLTSNADGNLIITRARSGSVQTPLVLGKNIRSASGRFSHRNRFSLTTVKGDHAGSDNAWGEEVTGRAGSAIDPRITRYRPTIIIAEDQVDNTAAKQRADWHVSVAYGRSQRMTYTVDGWSQAGGLWVPNHRVFVDDSWSGLHGNYLISSVRYTMDERGQRSEITVMPPEAFDLIPLPEATDVNGWAS